MIWKLVDWYGTYTPVNRQCGVMSRLKDLRRPRSSRGPSSADFTWFTTGFFGLSGGTLAGIDEREGELGNDGLLDFEPLERADV